jgi:hypothetical protein
LLSLTHKNNISPYPLQEFTILVMPILEGNIMATRMFRENEGRFWLELLSFGSPLNACTRVTVMDGNARFAVTQHLAIEDTTGRLEQMSINMMRPNASRENMVHIHTHIYTYTHT